MSISAFNHIVLIQLFLVKVVKPTVRLGSILLKVLFYFFSILILSSVSHAALIRSVGNGDWNDPATWDLGRLPQDGDEIIIDVGHIVTIPLFVEISLDNVIIAVRGELSIPLLGALTLDSNSSVVIETGGSLSGFLSFVTVGGTTIPIFTPLSGPSYIDTGGVTTGGTPPGYIPLPIELISFNIQLAGNIVEIDWATATELNNDFFTIERSIDGLEWSVIGELEGTGDSHVRLDYQFIDFNPMPGLSYYRLKQTDFDGQFEYFDPAVLLYEPDNLFKVFPNPAQNVLNLTTSSNLEDATIIIKNLNGQQEQVFPLVNSHQAEMDVSSLPPGVYVLEIVFPESTLTRRILKK